MGKKSKKKKAAAGRLTAQGSSSGLAAGGVVVVAGSVGGSGSGSIGKKRNVKCFRCFGTVKISEGKGHQCPGCLEIYCYRCEKKNFIECRNGSECVKAAGPCTVCKACFENDTLRRLAKDGKIPGETPMSEVIAFVERDDNPYSLDGVGGFPCNNFSRNNTCDEWECPHCFFDPKTRRLAICADTSRECTKTLCRFCYRAANTAAIESVLGVECDSFEKESILAKLFQANRDGMCCCTTCGTFYCFEHADDHLRMSIAPSASTTAPEVEFELSGTCNRCYWKGKPCTNPDCPNEPGVPTKRCGACRIARYCSKECQAAAHPNHVKKCEKIQATRAACLEKEGCSM